VPPPAMLRAAPGGGPGGHRRYTTRGWLPVAPTLPAMSRFAFRLPQVTFEREWVLGPATFRPAGALHTEVNGLPDFTAQVKNYGLMLDRVRGMARDWSADTTVEVEADEDASAVDLASQAIAILRLFMRPEVSVNVGLHKIGLEGDVSLAVREVIAIDRSRRVGFGGRLVDGPVPFTFTRAVLDKWDADPRLQFLAAQLSSPTTRSHLGSRALTAIAMLDIGFMATKPTVKVLSFAVAIEAMLSREPQASTKGQRTESPLSLARRVAYLTCPRQCGRAAPPCPYINGFPTERAFREFVHQYTQKGEDWRCSAFLRIACPVDFDGAVSPPSMSLFSARHQVAHDGMTTATERDIKWFNHFADQAMFAALEWCAAHPAASITGLDDEIDAAASSSTP
jgi:hypothetical protein